jgi:site-specific DNA recombinase
VRELKHALDAEGAVSKRRLAADGNPYGGNSFSRGALYQMLQNRVYRGEIVHKGAAYPGEHPAIVEEDLWPRVQDKLEANGVERIGARDRAKLAYLLAGVVVDAEGETLTPTHAIKKGVRYRYCASRRLITEGTASGQGEQAGRDQARRGQSGPSPSGA